MLTKCKRVGYYRTALILPLFLLWNLVTVYSQTDTGHKKINHNWFDQIIGIENSGLYNGAVYVEKHRMHNKRQKFLFSTSFLQGSIDYDGQMYFDVAMKYDVFEDEVVIKLSNELLLDKNKIAHFTINGHLFEKIDHTVDNGAHGGVFFERLIENPFFNFIKRYHKDEREIMGEKLVYHEFVDRNEYFLLYQETFHNIRSITDIVNVFPNLANEIETSLKKLSRKIGKEEYFLAILNGVHLMMSKENSKKEE